MFIIVFCCNGNSWAAFENNGIGDIGIATKSELDNQITGCTATLRLSGADGSLYTDDDVVVTRADGAVNDDDGAGAADGDIEFASGTSFTPSAGDITNGSPYTITIEKAGFVTYLFSGNWSDSGSNNSTVNEILYTVKVIVRNNDGDAIENATASLTGGDSATDDGSDPDSNANGVIFFAQDPAALGAGPHTMTVSLTGFIDWIDNTKTITSGAQTVYTTGLLLDYTVRITLTDELGNTGISPWEADYNCTGPGDVEPAAVATPTVYLSLDPVDSPSTCTVSATGYVNALTGALTFSDTVQASASVALPFALKVVVFNEHAKPLTGSSVSHGGAPPAYADMGTDGNTYYFTSTSAGTLEVLKDGYVNLDTTTPGADTGLNSVGVSPAAQTVVTLSGSAPYTGGDPAGNAVTGNGLDYRLRVEVSDQFGNEMDDIWELERRHFGGSQPDSTSGNTAFWEVTSAFGQALEIHEDGYVNAETTNPGLANVTTLSSTQTVIIMGRYASHTAAITGDTTYVRGLEWGLKVNTVNDELGGGLTQNSADSVVFYEDGGTCADAAGGNPAGVFDITDGAFYGRPTDNDTDTFYAAYSKAGYVTGCESAGNGTTVQPASGQQEVDLLSVSDGALPYTVKVLGATDELNQPIYMTATATAFAMEGFSIINTSYADSCHPAPDDDLACAYLAVVPTGGSEKLVMQHQGYLPAQTHSAFTPVSTSAKTVAFDEDSSNRFAAGVDGPALTTSAGHLIVYIQDEIAQSLSGAALSYNCDGSQQTCADEDDCDLSATGSSYIVVTPDEDAGCDEGDTVTAAVTRNGYVTQSAVSFGEAYSPLEPDGLHATATLQFGLKVTVADQFGSDMDADSLDTATFAAAAPATSTGNIAYWADTTTSGGTLSLRKDGYVNAETTNTGLADISTSSTEQTEILLGRYSERVSSVASGENVQALGLEWLLMVTALRDVIGDESMTQASDDIVTFWADADCDSDAGAAAMFDVDTARWYGRHNTAETAHYVKYYKRGYVERCAPAGVDSDPASGTTAFKLIPSNSSQLDHPVYIDTLEDELGIGHSQALSDHAGVFTDFECKDMASVAESPEYYAGGGRWLLAAPPGAYYFKYSKPGFVDKCLESPITVNASSTTGIDFTNIQYTVKVLPFDEQNHLIYEPGGAEDMYPVVEAATGSTAVQFTVDNTTPYAGETYRTDEVPTYAGPSSGSLYVPVVPSTSGSLTSFAVEAPEMVRWEDNTKRVNSEAQTVYDTSLEQLQYPLRLTVMDEFTNPIKGAKATLSHSGTSQSVEVTDGVTGEDADDENGIIYIPFNLDGQDSLDAELTVERSGYVTATMPVELHSTYQATETVRMLLICKVYVDDEISANSIVSIEGDDTTITFANKEPKAKAGNVAYFNRASGSFFIRKKGYVNIPGAETDLPVFDFTSQPDYQHVILLSGPGWTNSTDTICTQPTTTETWNSRRVYVHRCPGLQFSLVIPSGLKYGSGDEQTDYWISTETTTQGTTYTSGVTFDGSEMFYLKKKVDGETYTRESMLEIMHKGSFHYRGQDNAVYEAEESWFFAVATDSVGTDAFFHNIRIIKKGYIPVRIPEDDNDEEQFFEIKTDEQVVLQRQLGNMTIPMSIALRDTQDLAGVTDIAARFYCPFGKEEDLLTYDLGSRETHKESLGVYDYFIDDDKLRDRVQNVNLGVCTKGNVDIKDLELMEYSPATTVKTTEDTAMVTRGDMEDMDFPVEDSTVILKVNAFDINGNRLSVNSDLDYTSPECEENALLESDTLTINCHGFKSLQYAIQVKTDDNEFAKKDNETGDEKSKLRIRDCTIRNELGKRKALDTHPHEKAVLQSDWIKVPDVATATINGEDPYTFVRFCIDSKKEKRSDKFDDENWIRVVAQLNYDYGEISEVVDDEDNENENKEVEDGVISSIGGNLSLEFGPADQSPPQVSVAGAMTDLKPGLPFAFPSIDNLPNDSDPGFPIEISFDLDIVDTASDPTEIWGVNGTSEMTYTYQFCDTGAILGKPFDESMFADCTNGSQFTPLSLDSLRRDYDEDNGATDDYIEISCSYQKNGEPLVPTSSDCALQEDFRNANQRCSLRLRFTPEDDMIDQDSDIQVLRIGVGDIGGVKLPEYARGAGRTAGREFGNSNFSYVLLPFVIRGMSENDKLLTLEGQNFTPSPFPVSPGAKGWFNFLDPGLDNGRTIWGSIEIFPLDYPRNPVKTIHFDSRLNASISNNERIYIEWDGRSDAGSFVGPGVYGYLIKLHDGTTSVYDTGKLGVIR